MMLKGQSRNVWAVGMDRRAVWSLEGGHISLHSRVETTLQHAESIPAAVQPASVFLCDPSMQSTAQPTSEREALEMAPHTDLVPGPCAQQRPQQETLEHAHLLQKQPAVLQPQTHAVSGHSTVSPLLASPAAYIWLVTMITALKQNVAALFSLVSNLSNALRGNVVDVNQYQPSFLLSRLLTAYLRLRVHVMALLARALHKISPSYLPWWTWLALPTGLGQIDRTLPMSIGRLDVTVFEAQNVLGMRGLSSARRWATRVGMMRPSHAQASNGAAAQEAALCDSTGGSTLHPGFSHPFVEVSCGQHCMASAASHVVPGTVNPVWNESFSYGVFSSYATLRVTVWHYGGPIGRQPLGEIILPMHLFSDQNAHDMWINLRPCGAAPGGKGVLQIARATDSALGTRLEAATQSLQKRGEEGVAMTRIHALMPAGPVEAHGSTKVNSSAWNTGRRLRRTLSKALSMFGLGVRRKFSDAAEGVGMPDRLPTETVASDDLASHIGPRSESAHAFDAPLRTSVKKIVAAPFRFGADTARSSTSWMLGNAAAMFGVPKMPDCGRSGDRVGSHTRYCSGYRASQAVPRGAAAPLAPAFSTAEHRSPSPDPPVLISDAVVHDYGLGRIHVRVRLQYDPLSEFWSHWLHVEAAPPRLRPPFSAPLLIYNGARLYEALLQPILELFMQGIDLLTWKDVSASMRAMAFLALWSIWPPLAIVTINFKVIRGMIWTYSRWRLAMTGTRLSERTTPPLPIPAPIASSAAVMMPEPTNSGGTFADSEPVSVGLPPSVSCGRLPTLTLSAAEEEQSPIRAQGAWRHVQAVWAIVITWLLARVHDNSSSNASFVPAPRTRAEAREEARRRWFHLDPEDAVAAAGAPGYRDGGAGDVPASSEAGPRAIIVHKADAVVLTAIGDTLSSVSANAIPRVLKTAEAQAEMDQKAEAEVHEEMAQGNGGARKVLAVPLLPTASGGPGGGLAALSDMLARDGMCRQDTASSAHTAMQPVHPVDEALRGTGSTLSPLRVSLPPSTVDATLTGGTLVHDPTIVRNKGAYAEWLHKLGYRGRSVSGVLPQRGPARQRLWRRSVLGRLFGHKDPAAAFGGVSTETRVALHRPPAEEEEAGADGMLGLGQRQGASAHATRNAVEGYDPEGEYSGDDTEAVEVHVPLAVGWQQEGGPPPGWAVDSAAGFAAGASNSDRPHTFEGDSGLTVSAHVRASDDVARVIAAASQQVARFRRPSTASQVVTQQAARIGTASNPPPIQPNVVHADGEGSERPDNGSADGDTSVVAAITRYLYLTAAISDRILPTTTGLTRTLQSIQNAAGDAADLCEAMRHLLDWTSVSASRLVIIALTCCSILVAILPLRALLLVAVLLLMCIRTGPFQFAMDLLQGLVSYVGGSLARQGIGIGPQWEEGKRAARLACYDVVADVTQAVN